MAILPSVLKLLWFFVRLTTGVALAASGDTPLLPITWNLNSGRVSLDIGFKGISKLEMLTPPSQSQTRGENNMNGPATVFSADVDDGFTLSLQGFPLIDSSKLPEPVWTTTNETFAGLKYTDSTNQLVIDVEYSLKFGASFATKAILLQSVAPRSMQVNVTSLATFDGTVLTIKGQPCNSSFIASSHYGLKGYALFLRWDTQKGSSGAFLSTQNPYLDIKVSAGVGAATLAYDPIMVWNTSNVFHVDKGVIGVHTLQGRTLQSPADPIDVSEQTAMVAAVRSELVVQQNPSKTVKINIAWTENDYELDIALEKDREQYKRIIDRASEYGITHILFAPQNSDVSSPQNNTDAWGWEQLLWFGMGQRLRKGLWKPGDALPASLTEMLSYFKLRNVKPVAYVYPILAFLAGTLPGGGDPPWIVNGTYDLEENTPQAQRDILGAGPKRSSLASPEFQTWLPNTLVAFANATGAGGFSFDYTYFEENLPVASQYAQWHGWRTILNRLHRAKGGSACGDTCVVDNRQQNHAWGPWMWAQGGTYAEPLMSDEQPGSWMFYEADLHTDRLSANEERLVAWNYRQLEFCPSELVPGFAFHQTDRDPTVLQKQACPNARCSNHSRERDFDILGYRYSLLSSIGTGGLNNVINMLPARDAQEFKLLPQEDIKFVQDWLQWTDNNVKLLQHTQVIPQLKQPSAGNLDGVVMVSDFAAAMFVYNPTSVDLNLSVPLDASLGFSCDAEVPFIVTQMASSARGSMSFRKVVVDCGELFNATIPATTALAFDVSGWGCVSAGPQVFGVETASAVVNISTGALCLFGAQGEAGTSFDVFVALPPGTQVIKSVVINGKQIKNFNASTYRGVPTITFNGAWLGTRFRKSQEIGSTDDFNGGVWTAPFTVPSSVIEQLTSRNKSYPIVYDLDPDGNNDANVPWLAPGRLLIFVKYKPLLNDTFDATGSIDGKDLIMRKAYNTIVRSPQRFIGYWADVTQHVEPNKQQTLTLNLPKFESQWLVKSGALMAGNDVDVLNNATVTHAKHLCSITHGCVGLTFANSNNVKCGDIDLVSKIYLKSSMSGNSDSGWCSVVKPAVIEGIFFDNVEILYSTNFSQ